MRKWILIFALLFLLICIGVSIFHGVFSPRTEPSAEKETLTRNNFFLQVKENWRAEMREGDIGEVYLKLQQHLPNVHQDVHTGAHVLGELLYEEAGLAGLSVCTSDNGFGCYHGFFNAAINKEGIEVLPKLDAACKEAYGQIDTRCQHGLGHGLLVYTGYENLSDALELCTTINSPKMGSCLNGVFMEYNFHTMEKPGEEYYREIGDISLAYEPCVSIDSWYREACYQEQSHWWAEVFGGDFAMIGALCEQIIKQEERAACFQGTGETITTKIGYYYDSVLEICNALPTKDAAELCRQGASWRFVGRSGEDRDHYIQLCDSLSSERKESCMSLLDAW